MTPAPSSSDVDRFRSLIAERFGLDFEEDRRDQLAQLLQRRAEARAQPCGQYLQRLVLEPPAGELQWLASALTIGESYFFRNSAQFDALLENVLPACMRARSGADPVRILSAGCSAGEEPYSLAICIRERFPDLADTVQITAVDVNPLALEKARQGRFSAWALRETSAERRARWFRPEVSELVLDAGIRRAVAFRAGNLADERLELWTAGAFDVVFCRNVLMYFTAGQARAAVARIASALVPGGHLFLGHAEFLRGLSDDFDLCESHDTFYYRRGTARAGRTQAPDGLWFEAIQQACGRLAALTHAQQEPPSRSLPDACHAPPTAVRAALELIQDERYDQALGRLAALWSEHPQDKDVLLLRALSLCHSGAFAAAEQAARQLVDADVRSAGAHYLLALCRDAMGDARGALDHDRIATHVDPGFAMARLHLGLLNRRAGRYDTARRELHQAQILLQQEEASRLQLYGGGFRREALITLCRTELAACADGA